MTAILLLSALAGQLASEQRARAREIARLHEAMLALAAEPHLAALRAALVAWARRLTGASQAALVAVHGGDAVVDPAGVGPDLAGLPVQEAARVPGTVLVGRDRHGQQALLVGVERSASVLVLWGTQAGTGSTCWRRWWPRPPGRWRRPGCIRRSAASSVRARLWWAGSSVPRRRSGGASPASCTTGVGQDLAGLVLGLEALERSPGTIEVAELKQLARSTAEQIRELIVDLRPRVLDDLGLGRRAAVADAGAPPQPAGRAGGGAGSAAALAGGDRDVPDHPGGS